MEESEANGDTVTPLWKGKDKPRSLAVRGRKARILEKCERENVCVAFIFGEACDCFSAGGRNQLKGGA